MLVFLSFSLYFRSSFRSFPHCSQWYLWGKKPSNKLYEYGITYIYLYILLFRFIRIQRWNRLYFVVNRHINLYLCPARWCMNLYIFRHNIFSICFHSVICSLMFVDLNSLYFIFLTFCTHSTLTHTHDQIKHTTQTSNHTQYTPLRNIYMDILETDCHIFVFGVFV